MSSNKQTNLIEGLQLHTSHEVCIVEHFNSFFEEIKHVIPSLKSVTELDSTGILVLTNLYLDYKKRNNFSTT